MHSNNSGQEQYFDESEILLSTTELDSTIKYANSEFCKIAGFTLDELKDNPHNRVRHPDMPKAAFKDLWQVIQQGKSWMGPVKNKCKNGDYYWVNAYVTGIKNQQGQNVEYQSVRTKLDGDVLNRAKNIYQKLNKGETPLVIKQHTDMTFWFQLIFVVFFLLSAGVTFFSEVSLFLSLPLLFMSAVATGLFHFWRLKYTRLVQDARKVFDNKLMSYLYSGNNDAIGNIELALSMRKAEINAIVGRVNDVSLHVSENANTSAKTNDRVAKDLVKQRAETEQVATAINEMSATVQDLSRSIADAALASEQGRVLSEEGQGVVETAIKAIGELAGQLGEVDAMITHLVVGSKSIESVLTEISSIADQTNLLALNAAIEAARAGEQGRGFAVVAEEVRALALRTQSSTQEINTLLAKLQTDSNNAVVAMKKGNELSENCVQLSEQAGESLSNVSAEVSQISDLTTQIATAIEEQSVVTEEISQNIVKISELALTCEKHGTEAITLTKELLQQLDDQQSLISQFKG